MSTHRSPEESAPDNSADYDDLIRLEELESLLEELEEDASHAEAMQQLHEAGVADTEALRHLIARLHAHLDEKDEDA